jgi:hypothetical protein
MGNDENASNNSYNVPIVRIHEYIYIMGNIPAVTADELLQQNQNGGFYQPGRMYDLPRKFGVGQTYLQLWQLSFPARPSASELARESNVGWEYADKVIWKIHL